MGPTRHLSYDPRTVRKADVDPAAWSVTALLTYPTHDLAGDYVRPEGLVWREHEADPWIDLEHGLDPDVGRRPVGWARKSLHRDGGKYAVQYLTVDIYGKSHTLPFGTTYFDRDDPLQRQTFRLCEAGALPGVSLEFRPDMTFAKSLGRSPLEARNAYDFGRASVVRWTLCVRPVNPGALTVLKSLPPPDALHRALRDGRIGGEALHPVIRKSLGHYLPARVVRTTESKAMSPDPMASAYDDPDAAPAPEETPEDDAGGSGTPTAQAAFDASQQFADLGEQVKTICEQTLAALKSGEHVKGRKAVAKVCETAEAELQPLFEKLAADLADIGDAVAADLADDDADEPEEPSEVEEETPEEPDEVEEPEDPTQKAVPLARGADGVLARIPAVFRKAIKRFTAAEIAAPAGDPDVAYFANLQKSDPAAYADLCRSTRKVEREKKAADRWKKYTT